MSKQWRQLFLFFLEPYFLCKKWYRIIFSADKSFISTIKRKMALKIIVISSAPQSSNSTNLTPKTVMTPSRRWVRVWNLWRHRSEAPHMIKNKDVLISKVTRGDSLCAVRWNECYAIAKWRGFQQHYNWQEFLFYISPLVQPPFPFTTVCCWCHKEEEELEKNTTEQSPLLLCGVVEDESGIHHPQLWSNNI